MAPYMTPYFSPSTTTDSTKKGLAPKAPAPFLWRPLWWMVRNMVSYMVPYILPHGTHHI